MKKLVLVVFALAVVLAVTPAAKADGFQFYGIADGALTGDFTFSVTGNTINSASLSIFSSDLPSYYPTTGTWVYQPAGSFYVNSNLAQFVFTNGGITVDLFDIGSGWQLEKSAVSVSDEFITPVPEPSSLLLLGSGLFLLAAGIFWKSRSKTQLAKQPQPHLT